MKYDVYKNHINDHDLLLDIQDDMLSDLNTRVIIPLIKHDKSQKPISILNPIIAIGENNYILLTQSLLSIPCQKLKTKVTNIENEAYIITRALDLLLTGV